MKVIKGPASVIFLLPYLGGADAPVQLRHLPDSPVQLGQAKLQPDPPAGQLGPLLQPPPLPAAVRGGEGFEGGLVGRVSSLDQYAGSFTAIQCALLLDSVDSAQPTVPAVAVATAALRD